MPKCFGEQRVASKLSARSCLISWVNLMKISGPVKENLVVPGAVDFPLINLFAQCRVAINCPKAATILTPLVVAVGRGRLIISAWALPY